MSPGHLLLLGMIKGRVGGAQGGTLLPLGQAEGGQDMLWLAHKYDALNMEECEGASQTVEGFTPWGLLVRHRGTLGSSEVGECSKTQAGERVKQARRMQAEPYGGPP